MLYKQPVLSSQNHKQFLVLNLRMHKGFKTILRIFFYKYKTIPETYIKPYIIRKLNKFSFY